MNRIIINPSKYNQIREESLSLCIYYSPFAFDAGTAVTMTCLHNRINNNNIQQQLDMLMLPNNSWRLSFASLLCLYGWLPDGESTGAFKGQCHTPYEPNHVGMLYSLVQKKLEIIHLGRVTVWWIFRFFFFFFAGGWVLVVVDRMTESSLFAPGISCTTCWVEPQYNKGKKKNRISCNLQQHITLCWCSFPFVGLFC